MLPPYIPGKAARQRARIQELLRQHVDLQRLLVRLPDSPDSFRGIPAGYVAGEALITAVNVDVGVSSLQFNSPAATVSVSLKQSKQTVNNTLVTGGSIGWNSTPRATFTISGGTTREVALRNFGFSIPSGAVVTDVDVEIIRERSAFSTITTASLDLSKDGTTSAQAVSGDTANWGLSELVSFPCSLSGWSGADINSSNFAVILSATMDNPGTVNAGNSWYCQINQVSVTVYYQ